MSDEKHPADGLPVEKIEMLGQPLLTEEGFVNEACLAELEAAIRDVPKTHERLAGNPEWSTRHPTSLGDIVGALAGNAVRQAGVRHPPGLDAVIGFLRACLVSGPFSSDAGAFGNAEGDGIVIATASLCDVNRWLWEFLGEMPEIARWNDPDRMECFIDIHALFHNVCLSIRNDRRHMLAFNRKFKRECGE